MIFTQKANFIASFLLKTIFIAVFYLPFIVKAQNFNLPLSLNWENTARILSNSPEGATNLNYPFFVGAVFDENQPTLPVMVQKINLQQSANLEVALQNEIYEPLGYELAFSELLTADIQLVATLNCNKKRPQAHIKFIPLRRNPATNQIEKLISADLILRAQPFNTPNQSNSRNAINSKLSNGEIYKIAVSNSGIYKIDYNFLKNLGVNIDAINPQQIQILGNDGKMLPELNADLRTDDLAENAIFVQGQADGRFDAQDYILFYAQGTTSWQYDNATAFYKHQLH